MLHFCFLFRVLAVEHVVNALEDLRSATETVETYLRPAPGSASFGMMGLRSECLIFELDKPNNNKKSAREVNFLKSNLRNEFIRKIFPNINQTKNCPISG